MRRHLPAHLHANELQHRQLLIAVSDWAHDASYGLLRGSTAGGPAEVEMSEELGEVVKPRAPLSGLRVPRVEVGGETNRTIWIVVLGQAFGEAARGSQQGQVQHTR